MGLLGALGTHPLFIQILKHLFFISYDSIVDILLII